LAGLPNVILTPHIGAQTIDTQVEIGHRILQIMQDLSAGQNLQQYDMSSQFEHWL
jgi:phosphoglycerate dehydrogenase-like enzyme